MTTTKTEIIKLAGHYLEWGDRAPVGFAMTIDTLKRMMARRGKEQYLELVRSLRAVELRGTSEEGAKTVDDTVRNNSARLAKEELVEFYVRRRMTPTPAELEKFRARVPKCEPCKGRKCTCWGSGRKY